MALAALSVAAAATAGRLAVPVAPDGSFNVTVDGVVWFKSAPPAFRHQGARLSGADNSLKLLDHSPYSGPGWHGATQRWAAAVDGTQFETSVKVYDGYAVFTQSFPDGAAKTTAGDRNGLISEYPNFVPQWTSPKGVVSFQGDMTGDGTKTGGWDAASARWHSAATMGSNHDSMDACRIVTDSYSLVGSSQGYDAYIPTGSRYTQHAGEYCNDNHNWAFHSNDMNLTQCMAKCASMSCKCFDFKSGRPHSTVIGQGIGGTGPVVAFNQDLKTSLVLSPFSNFMAANQNVDATTGAIRYGIMGGVIEVPKGYSLATVITLGEGVNSAMDSWGDVLLKTYGKSRYAYKRDMANQYLGYSTDNGAYYYYQTEPGKNYEDTLIDVQAYAKKVGIPYKYVLLDSWWYYKGNGGGVATWEVRPDIFPDGMAGFFNKTQWPQQLHNRYWSNNTSYAKANGGQYNFILDGSKVAMPDDQTFWNDLIANKTSTGAFMYEQDWLFSQFDMSKTLGESATMGVTWMTQMNNGAVHANQTIQMCMSYVRNILQSVTMSQVTNSRASDDYHPGNNQWNTGTTALLAHAVGIAPSKDNYWSTAVQPGTHYGNKTKEPHSRFQAAVISLTNGPVAPSDMVGGSDPALIMRCCDATGKLLAPDRPAREIDAHFSYLAFQQGVNGNLWVTQAEVSGQLFHYAIGINIQSEYALSAAQLGYGAGDRLLAVSEGDTTARVFDSDHPLVFAACGLDDFKLYTIARSSGAFTLLGEEAKWVSVSPQRFSDLTPTSVRVHGAPGEVVGVRWAAPDGRIFSASCTLGSGPATSTVTAQGATCS
eukprot:TRINITY_DN693_c0_g1_i1.p1 TRINITY_DN693_c0_g1~~TRINITY_DN693_c0_g1_i1.p1  ORF type:complete len:850 (+),score=240.54 TRINITY_DN693_c0_g1_i1:91-2550(+)